MTDSNIQPSSGNVFVDLGFSEGEAAVLAQTSFGAVGMTVCYDLRFGHLHRVVLLLPLRQTDDDGEIRPHFSAHGFQNIGGKAATLHQVATAMGVVAQVGAVPEERRMSILCIQSAAVDDAWLIGRRGLPVENAMSP